MCWLLLASYSGVYRARIPAQSLARSLVPSLARSLRPSLPRSLHPLLARFLARTLAASFARWRPSVHRARPHAHASFARVPALAAHVAKRSPFDATRLRSRAGKLAHALATSHSALMSFTTASRRWANLAGVSCHGLRRSWADFARRARTHAVMVSSPAAGACAACRISAGAAASSPPPAWPPAARTARACGRHVSS